MAGFTALGFVLLGVIFSLRLPDTRHREEEVVIVGPEPEPEPEPGPKREPEPASA